MFCNYFSVPFWYLTIAWWNWWMKSESWGQPLVVSGWQIQTQRSQIKSIKCLQDVLSKTCKRMSFICSVFNYNADNTSKYFTSTARFLAVGHGSYKHRNHLKPENLKTLFFICGPQNSSQASRLLYKEN